MNKKGKENEKANIQRALNREEDLHIYLSFFLSLFVSVGTFRDREERRERDRRRVFPLFGRFCTKRNLSQSKSNKFERGPG